jgi:hypothetical protein
VNECVNLRHAISRRENGAVRLEGHVSQDLKESGFGISDFCIQRNCCIRSHDFAIPDRMTRGSGDVEERESSHVHQGSAFWDSR